MIYFIIKYISKIYFYLVMCIFVRGLENIPKKGPAIIIANHPGLLDGFLIMTAIKRSFHTFAKEKVFNSTFKMLFLRSVYGIPVGNEEINKKSIIHAEKILKNNKILLILPEGKINAKPDLLPFKNSFLRLAVKCKVPIIPIVILGSEKSLISGQFFPRPHDIYINILAPLRINISNDGPDELLNKKELQYHTERIRKKIQHNFTFLREMHANS